MLNQGELHSASPIAQSYRKFVVKRVVFLSLLAVALIVTLVFDVATGPANLSVVDVIKGILSPEQLEIYTRVIIWEVRVPYALMAVVAGASLGLAGAEMQTALNNPLASPFTLGIGAAATLGASVAILFKVNWFGLSSHYVLPLFAFVFAAAASLLILALSRYRGATVNTVILFGIAISFALSALVSLLQFLSDANSLQQIIFWSMGSLARATMDKVALVALVLLVCLPWSMSQTWAMTALRGGEEQARSLGIRVERLRLVVLLRVSLLTAAALAFIGEIGFIGLVGPHIARMLLGEDHRFFLPASALSGALLLSLSSIASKAIIPGVVLPVGIVTALVGIPLFISIILTRSEGR